MAATKDIARAYEAGVEPVFNDYGIASGATIYEGAVVTIGATDNLATASFGGEFAGFAMSRAVQGTQSTVQVRSRGVVKLVTDGTPDVGDAVYATDNDTFTQDSTATGAAQIGKVHRVESGTTVLVYFEAESLRSV